MIPVQTRHNLTFSPLQDWKWTRTLGQGVLGSYKDENQNLKEEIEDYKSCSKNQMDSIYSNHHMGNLRSPYIQYVNIPHSLQNELGRPANVSLTNEIEKLIQSCGSFKEEKEAFNSRLEKLEKLTTDLARKNQESEKLVARLKHISSLLFSKEATPEVVSTDLILEAMATQAMEDMDILDMGSSRIL
ncbi:hypothetical protein QYM36_005939 [Artemia franciscana]|uniref:Uncharacterized protein n=1 Tax=Artemia franciscana TaxID=6661 RepID=A0AA88HVC9_ARTSF|nr:hypothetical protein QYM36_005939 [Artemia franciscana]